MVVLKGVEEAETKLKDDAAKRAAVEANRMLSMLPAELFLFFAAEVAEAAAPVVVQEFVEAIIKAAAEGGR